MPTSSSLLPASTRKLRLHVWMQSYTAAPGGIQTFSRFVVRALRELYPETEIVVFAKNDRSNCIERIDREVAVNDTRVACDPQTVTKNDSASAELRRDEGGRDPGRVTKNEMPTSSSQLPAASAQLLASSSQLPAASSQSPASNSQLPASTKKPASSSQLPAPTTSVVGFGGWPGPLRVVAFAVGVIWRAVRTSQRDVPTIIISTHVNFAPVGRLVKRFANVSFAAIGHGIEVWTIQKASVRGGLRCADQLIAVSEFTRTRMAAAVGVNESRIEVLPNTFDVDRFQPGPKPASLLERYGLTAEQPVILTVARLAETEQYKGYDNVLLALPAVLHRFADARYVIVGDGPDRKRVERLSRELGVEKKVIMAGYVPNEELAGHYNLCDVFVMPSKGEGFGIVFLEALGCGKPVIAGNKDASAEAVLNGKLGMMVDPVDGGQIADAICRVLLERSQQSAVSGQRSAEKIAGGSQQAGGSGQQTENRELPFDGEMLRREVIAAYGFERFRERLGEIMRLLVKS